MISVSAEQELGKKCNFGTLEKIVPLHHACLFCMCRNIENWSNLPMSSWMRRCCYYWKVLPPRNGYTFATQAIWKTHFGQSWITTLKSLAPKEESLSRHPWPQFQIAIIIFNNMLHSILCFHVWSQNSESWSSELSWRAVLLLKESEQCRCCMLLVFRYSSKEG